MFFLAALAGLAGGVVCAQGPPAPPLPPPAAPLHEEATKNVAAPCVEPPPMVRLEDYDGPLKKTVGTFARPLERKAVHPAHYKPGAILCTLKLKDKFELFVQDSLDPVTFLATAFNAGLDQAEDSDPSYGQGAEGYGKRFGAEFAGQADGKRMFNFSEWLGTTSTVVLSNTYHPDAQRGFASAAQRVSFSILQDTGFDVLREFWPEISRKFKLPFRGESEPANLGSIPATK